MRDNLKLFGHRLLIKRTNHPLVQLIRYGLVVSVAAPMDFFGYLLLLNVGLYPVMAATISFVVSLIANYFLSVKWAFNDDGQSKKTKALVFFGIGLVGLGLTDLIIWVCIDYLDIHEITAKIIALCIVFFWSFTARRYLFQARRFNKVINTQK